MTTISITDTSADLAAPVPSSERIQALDVVRGFALIGIFLMNIEYFNRALGNLGDGLPATMTGADWVAGWLIYNFVQGKFWTMFSLLFGMGFAVMLTRAERADRNFLRPYLRRIAALAMFGTMHFIFIWGGDILFSYSVGAVGLLILLYGNWKAMVLSIITLLALSFLPALEPLRPIAFGLVVVSLGAWFLRGDATVKLFGRSLLAFSALFLALGAVLALVSLAMWLGLGSAEFSEGRVPLTVMTVVALLISWLSARYHEPVEPRTRRLGVAMYLFPFLMMTTFGIVQYFSPKEPLPPPAATATVAEAGATVAKADAVATAKADAVAAFKADAKAAAKTNAKAAAPEKKKTKAERVAERRAEAAKEEKEHQQGIADETRVLSSGTYVEAVKLRAHDYAEHAPGQAGFAMVIIGMFLIGTWFVRSGVMENTGAHLPLFRKLALYGLPVGVGLGLLGSAIATARTPGLEGDPYLISMGLSLIGNLPACLGYVSLIVLALHSGTALAKIAVLAPLGRMALTNYLTHSIIGTLYFYGYGLGHWGMPRAWQVLFVAVVITLQVIFCHWWLARFRYGPMEWLWRAITYWQIPPMRREASDPVGGRPLSA